MPNEALWIAVSIYLIAMSALLFIVMGMDKSFAKKGKRRVPEKLLFLLAGLGGAIGGIFGMNVFQHKTLHKTFTIGMPLLLLLNIGCIVLVFKLFAS